MFGCAFNVLFVGSFGLVVVGCLCGFVVNSVGILVSFVFVIALRLACCFIVLR